MKKNPALAALLGTTLLASGCYQQIYDAVVDKSDASPGGAVAMALGGTTIGTLPGLATQTPTSIAAGNVTFSLSIVAGDDADGTDAHTALGIAGTVVTMKLTDDTRSAIQLHYGGDSCIAQTGTIELIADSDLKITGSYTGTGAFLGTGKPCDMSGSISNIPQVR